MDTPHITKAPISSYKVHSRRDPVTGDLVLSEAPGGWSEFFAAIDNDPFPEDFLSDRDRGA